MVAQGLHNVSRLRNGNGFKKKRESVRASIVSVDGLFLAKAGRAIMIRPTADQQYWERDMGGEGSKRGEVNKWGGRAALLNHSEDLPTLSNHYNFN